MRIQNSKSALIGLLAALFFGISAAASASVTYNVNLIGNDSNFGSGVATLTGVIATDGVTGTLLPSDITSFHLAISGPVSFQVDSAYDRFTCSQSGCNLYVSGNQLIAGNMAQVTAAADQGTTTPLPNIFFQHGINSTYQEINFVSALSSWGGIITQGLIQGWGKPTYLLDNAQSPIVVGNAVSAVPVPGAAWLLGSGIIGLAGVSRKCKTA